MLTKNNTANHNVKTQNVRKLAPKRERKKKTCEQKKQINIRSNGKVWNEYCSYFLLRIKFNRPVEGGGGRGAGLFG